MPAANFQPLIVTPDPSAVCSVGVPPEVMTGVLAQLLRAHFSEPDQIVDERLRDLVWADAPSSPILVETIDAFHPDKVGVRPALIVRDHGVKPVRAGIADRMDGTFAADGQDRFMSLLNSSCTVFCMAGASLEAKQLATEVLDELVMFSEPIRTALALVRFVVLDRSDCFIVEESKQHFAVPITIAYQYTRSWKLAPITPRIRKFVLNITTTPYQES